MTAIREFIFTQPLFSTHDHQYGFTFLEGKLKDISYQQLFGYGVADLASAGLRWNGPGAPPVSDREFQDLWPLIETTGYGQAIQYAVTNVLGRDLTAENGAEITGALREFCKGKTAAQIHDELYERANVQWDINDIYWQRRIQKDHLDGSEYPALMRHALRFDRDKLLTLSAIGDIKAYEEEFGRPLRTVAEIERMMQEYIQEAVSLGRLVALKSAVAYLRPLDFGPPDRPAAEAVLNDILRGRDGKRRPLHDYLFHFLVRQGREFNLPVQIHTGFLASSIGDLRWSDPALLIPVFQDYRDVRFDLFHAGWPFSAITSAIGKMFPNVWLDLCWAWAANPVRAAFTLEEWLASVPNNKIFAFGADTVDPFTLTGYAEQARRGLAGVLERKMAAGEYDEATAQRVALRLMSGNAREFFGI